MDTNMQFTIKSFRQLFLDKIFSLTIPRQVLKAHKCYKLTSVKDTSNDTAYTAQ